MHQAIKNIPTNIITGFLGVGKTTAIQQLLNHKPKGERWAILVNEFGEIGIDGVLINSQNEQNIFIREVPGGCMCCASGVPMQVALNQLLAAAKPDRLLIEPTGLGHPTEVLMSLTQPHFQGVLLLGATLTLVDARKISEPKWATHATFIEQLKIADHIIASKADLYQHQEMAELSDYLNAIGVNETPVHIAVHGNIDQTLLADKTHFKPVQKHKHRHAHASSKETIDVTALLNTQGKVQVSNQGQGFYSCGWAFSAERSFSFNHIISMLSNLEVFRLKAVLNTDQGIFGFNISDGVLNHFELSKSDDSRLEFICADKEKAQEIAAKLEKTLLT